MILMQEIIEETENLDPFSPTIARLANIINNEKSTIKDIINVMKYDQAVTAMVLKFANSVFSGSRKKVETIREAVIRLGGSRILAYCIGNKVKSVMSMEIPEYGYKENELWRHSVASAVCVECLRAFTERSISGVAFTASLLHDIGKLILVRVVPKEDMDKVWNLVEEDPEDYTCEQAEKKILGMSHSDVGARITSHWKFPFSIVNAIEKHHVIDYQPDSVTDSVKIANVVAKSIGEGLGREGMGIEMESSLADRLGLRRENFEGLCANTADRLEDVLLQYGG